MSKRLKFSYKNSVDNLSNITITVEDMAQIQELTGVFVAAEQQDENTSRMIVEASLNNSICNLTIMTYKSAASSNDKLPQLVIDFHTLSTLTAISTIFSTLYANKIELHPEEIKACFDSTILTDLHFRTNFIREILRANNFVYALADTLILPLLKLNDRNKNDILCKNIIEILLDNEYLCDDALDIMKKEILPKVKNTELKSKLIDTVYFVSGNFILNAMYFTQSKENSKTQEQRAQDRYKRIEAAMLDLIKSNDSDCVKLRARLLQEYAGFSIDETFGQGNEINLGVFDAEKSLSDLLRLLTIIREQKKKLIEKSELYLPNPPVLKFSPGKYRISADNETKFKVFLEKINTNEVKANFVEAKQIRRSSSYSLINKHIP